METIVKRYGVGLVSITKHNVEWTGIEDIAESVRQRLLEVPAEGTIYLNPEYTVSAKPEAQIDLFVKQARRAQVLWNKRFDRTLGRKARKSWIKRTTPSGRQLLFTGIMIVNGKPAHPKGWPDTVQTRD